MCLGIPGKVIEVTRLGDLGLVEGKVQFGDIVKVTNLSFTPDVEPGDYVVVHVGFAISQIDEEEALQTLSYLREIAELSELEDQDTTPAPSGPES